MQKIVIDTNVIVSSLIQRGFPNLIFTELYLEQKIQLCILEELLAEYYDVLARPKFSKFQDFFLKAKSLLVDIETRVKKYSTIITLDLNIGDDDNMILELEDEADADFNNTGNTNDFTFPIYKFTKIVTPSVLGNL